MGVDEGNARGPTGQEDDVLNDAGMEGLSLYEKKALLVNRELDSHGMGESNWLPQSCPLCLGLCCTDLVGGENSDWLTLTVGLLGSIC